MQVCGCVCHWEWVSVDGSQGRCKRPGKIVVVVGLKPVFSSRLWLRVCVCLCNASAFRGRQTPSCGVVCIMDARCVAAAYYHLVRGEDRVVITTSSSANGCVLSLNLHAQVICRVECVSGRRERDKDCTMLVDDKIPSAWCSLFVISAGHVNGWIWCGGPGAWDAGVSGDKHLRQWRSTRKWRGMHVIYPLLQLIKHRADAEITNSTLVIVEIRSCLNGDAPPNIQHRRQKVSLVPQPACFYICAGQFLLFSSQE